MEMTSSAMTFTKIPKDTMSFFGTLKRARNIKNTCLLKRHEKPLQNEHVLESAVFGNLSDECRRVFFPDPCREPLVSVGNIV
jgi:hypothetical protein